MITLTYNVKIFLFSFFKFQQLSFPSGTLIFDLCFKLCFMGSPFSLKRLLIKMHEIRLLQGNVKFDVEYSECLHFFKTIK